MISPNSVALRLPYPCRHCWPALPNLRRIQKSIQRHTVCRKVFAEGLFPIIHAIRANPSNKELINILKQKTIDENVKRYAVDYMERELEV